MHPFLSQTDSVVTSSHTTTNLNCYLKALDMYLMHSCVCCEFSRLVIFLLQPIDALEAPLLQEEKSIDPTKQVKLGFITGLVPHEKSVVFVRILFRANEATS
ncbi:hypothetical protein Bca4012_016707 [Brassica carinata]